MMLLVALWAMAEGCLFFVVADVPISWIGLHRGRRPALAAALLAAPMAALGGLGIALATQAAPDDVHRILVQVPGIHEGLLTAARHGWAQHGFWAMLAGSFSGVPYKLYAHAATLGGLGLAKMFGLSVAARLPRFLMVAFISGWLGKKLPQSRKGLGHIAFWLLFYACYFAAMAAKY